MTFLKVISLLNVVRTTTSASYTNTSDREPLWRWESADYDGINSIKLSVSMRAASGGTAFMVLTSVGGTDVTGSEVSTTSTVNVNVLSGDIQSNLTDNTDYRVRWKRTGSGTASLDTASIVISQTNATKTVTVIELAEDNAVPSTSYSAPAEYGIFKYDSDMFDGTVNIYLEADINTAGGETGYCALYNITDGAQVSSSEVSTTGNTNRVRSGAITLIDGKEYRPDIKGTSLSDDVTAAKIIIKQSGFTKTASYITILNTSSSGTNTTYSAQNRLFTFNNTDFSATTVNFYYEATLRVTANTGYSQLYNDTDASEISAVTTTSTTNARVRSTALTMPSDTANVLNNYRKIDTSGTVSHGRSFLIAELEEVSNTVNHNSLLLLGVG